MAKTEYKKNIIGLDSQSAHVISPHAKFARMTVLISSLALFSLAGCSNKSDSVSSSQIDKQKEIAEIQQSLEKIYSESRKMENALEKSKKIADEFIKDMSTNTISTKTSSSKN